MSQQPETLGQCQQGIEVNNGPANGKIHVIVNKKTGEVTELQLDSRGHITSVWRGESTRTINGKPVYDEAVSLVGSEAHAERGNILCGQSFVVNTTINATKKEVAITPTPRPTVVSTLTPTPVLAAIPTSQEVKGNLGVGVSGNVGVSGAVDVRSTVSGTEDVTVRGSLSNSDNVELHGPNEGAIPVILEPSKPVTLEHRFNPWDLWPIMAAAGILAVGRVITHGGGGGYHPGLRWPWHRGGAVVEIPQPAIRIETAAPGTGPTIRITAGQPNVQVVPGGQEQVQ